MKKKSDKNVGKKGKCLRLFYTGVLILIFLMLSGVIESVSEPVSEAPQKKPVIPYKEYTYAKTKQNISSLILKKMKKHKIMGLSIALVDDQKIVWADLHVTHHGMIHIRQKKNRPHRRQSIGLVQSPDYSPG